MRLFLLTISIFAQKKSKSPGHKNCQIKRLNFTDFFFPFHFLWIRGETTFSITSVPRYRCDGNVRKSRRFPSHLYWKCCFPLLIFMRYIICVRHFQFINVIRRKTIFWHIFLPLPKNSNHLNSFQVNFDFFYFLNQSYRFKQVAAESRYRWIQISRSSSCSLKVEQRHRYFCCDWDENNLNIQKFTEQ